jgi:hypothetical protein
MAGTYRACVPVGPTWSGRLTALYCLVDHDMSLKIRGSIHATCAKLPSVARRLAAERERCCAEVGSRSLCRKLSRTKPRLVEDPSHLAYSLGSARHARFSRDCHICMRSMRRVRFVGTLNLEQIRHGESTDNLACLPLAICFSSHSASFSVMFGQDGQTHHCRTMVRSQPKVARAFQ